MFYGFIAKLLNTEQNNFYKEEAQMGRRILAAALLVVTYNFLFLAKSAGHVKVGFAWLVVDLLLWLPELTGARVDEE